MAASLAFEVFSPSGYLFLSSSGRRVSPVVVVRSRDQLNSGFKAAQRPSAPIDVIKENRRCVQFIPFAGAGDRWQTVMGIRNSLASLCRSIFQRRRRGRLLPPQWSVII